MNITLINPPQVYSKFQVAAGVIPPLGIAYLASYCKKKEHNVTVIEAIGEAPDTITPWKNNIGLRGLNPEQIIERIPLDVELIGISNLFTVAFPFIIFLASRIKERFKVPIVLGGANASAMYKDALASNVVDFVIISEGEESLNQLTLFLQGKAKIQNIDGIAFKDNNKIKYNPKINFIADLDILPFPARDMLPMENYHRINEAHGPVSRKWTPIISSRGCPFACTFCTSEIWNKKWRYRSAKNVVAEIEYCINQWGISEFHFEDENLTFKRERIIEICDEIIRKGLNIKWQTPNGIRASVTDNHVLFKMKQSGCNHVVFAPESGSKRVLKEIMKKDSKLDRIADLIKYAAKIKLKTAAFFILGCPGERKEDIKLTMSYALKLARNGLDEAVFGLFIPLPGSRLYANLVKEGKFILDFEEMVSIGDLQRVKSWTEHINDQELAKLRLKAYLFFHLVRLIFHPFKVIGSFMNVLRGREETKTERVLLTFLRRLTKGKIKN